MQLFDRRYEEPLQRRQQAVNDAPIIPFFSFDFQFKGSLVGDTMQSQPLLTTNDLELAGLPLHLAGTCKMEILASNTSMFFVRMENLADSDFDTYWSYYEDHEDTIDVPIEDEPEELIPDYLNLDMLLALLIQKHVGGIAGVTMKIEETSLTGGELYSDMAAAKTKWASLYDEWIDESWLPKDPTKGGNLVTLEPQRIRMFRVSIIPTTSSNQTTFITQ